MLVFDGMLLPIFRNVNEFFQLKNQDSNSFVEDKGHKMLKHYSFHIFPYPLL